MPDEIIDPVAFNRMCHSAIVTAAARLKVDPLELARALEQGGIAEIVNALSTARADILSSNRTRLPCPNSASHCADEALTLIPEAKP